MFSSFPHLLPVFISGVSCFLPPEPSFRVLRSRWWFWCLYRRINWHHSHLIQSVNIYLWKFTSFHLLLPFTCELRGFRTHRVSFWAADVRNTKVPFWPFWPDRRVGWSAQLPQRPRLLLTYKTAEMPLNTTFLHVQTNQHCLSFFL